MPVSFPRCLSGISILLDLSNQTESPIWAFLQEVVLNQRYQSIVAFLPTGDLLKSVPGRPVQEKQ